MIRKFIMDKVEGEVENKTRIGGKFIKRSIIKHWPVYNQRPRNLQSIVVCTLCSLYQPHTSTSQKHDGNEQDFHKNRFQNSLVRRILLDMVDRSSVQPNQHHRHMHQSHGHRDHSLHNGIRIYILLQKCHWHILAQTKCKQQNNIYRTLMPIWNLITLSKHKAKPIVKQLSVRFERVPKQSILTETTDKQKVQRN